MEGVDKGDPARLSIEILAPVPNGSLSSNRKISAGELTEATVAYDGGIMTYSR